MRFKIKTENFCKHQKSFWDLTNRIKLLVGGYGCGKSYIAAMKGIYLSYLNSGYEGIIVSPTYPMAERTLVIELVKILTRSGIRFSYGQQKHVFKIHNWDGAFWIGSGDDPLSLRGPNLAWGGIDEPFIQKVEVFEQMQARVRVGPHQEIFMTGTPESLNWGYDIAMNEDDRYDIGIVRGKSRDNKHISQEAIDAMYRSYSPEMVAAYLEGEFVNLKQGRAYKVFERDRHIVSRGVEGVEICAGIDFNVDFMSAEIFAKGNGWMHFIDEIRLSNSNSFELSEMLYQKHPGIKIYPDATGSQRKSSSTKSDHQIFRDMGFSVYANLQNPAVMDRVNATNQMLMQDRLTIEPGTYPMFIKDLERVVFKSGDLDKTSDLSLTHASDAGTYPVAYLHPVLKREAYTISR